VPVAVSTDGACRGAVHADWRGVTDRDPVRVATAVDVDRFRSVVRTGIRGLAET
jgi:inosine-uridine nucleoside N-ribohydrolase